MKTRLAALVVVGLALSGPLLLAEWSGTVGTLHADEKKKDDKRPSPGKASWDVRAFNVYFNVIDTEYDPKTKQVKWTLETKNAYRTFDFERDIDRDRPFAFSFLDEEMQELVRIRLRAANFKGIPKDKTIKKGTRLELLLEVPDEIKKTKTVTLRRGIKD